MCHISSARVVRRPTFGFAGCTRSRGRRQPNFRTSWYQVEGRPTPCRAAAPGWRACRSGRAGTRARSPCPRSPGLRVGSVDGAMCADRTTDRQAHTRAAAVARHGGSVAFVGCGSGTRTLCQIPDKVQARIVGSVVRLGGWRGQNPLIKDKQLQSEAAALGRTAFSARTLTSTHGVTFCNLAFLNNARLLRDYSARRTLIGSTLVARHAGCQHANSVTTRTTAALPISVAPLVGTTP